MLKRKSDQETIACLASNWSTHIHLRQDRKLLSLSSAQGYVRTMPYYAIAAQCYTSGRFHDDAPSRH
ncbi:hypothetical protein GW17_00029820 [Ensete ventricosum]|nr:hypothetical protein GW17_00029820 [Ensete ventricosum]